MGQLEGVHWQLPPSHTVPTGQPEPRLPQEHSPLRQLSALPGGIVQSAQVRPLLPQVVGLAVVQLPLRQHPGQPMQPPQTPPSQPPVWQMPQVVLWPHELGLSPLTQFSL